MNVLTQTIDPAGIEAYLSAVGGILHMSHAGRDLIVEHATRVDNGKDIYRAYEHGALSSAKVWPWYGTVTEALNNPATKAAPPTCPGCGRPMVPTITNGWGCPVLSTKKCIKNTKGRVRVTYAKPEQCSPSDMCNPYDDLEMSVTGDMETVANWIDEQIVAGYDALSAGPEKPCGYVQGRLKREIMDCLQRGGTFDVTNVLLHCEHVN